MLEDSELLRRYVQERTEEAFAEVVRRHIDFVYGVALRRVGNDTHLAQEVCQDVFGAVAAKAAELARRPLLKGWLHTAAQFSAARTVRGEQRRKAREHQAHIMHELNEDTTARQWNQLRPIIDETISELGERDREAVLLRFFEERTFPEIGAKLSLSEDAARMRVERALEKIRTLLARQGVTSTSAALGVALASQRVIAAPAGFATAVTSAALAGTSAGAGIGALGAFGTFFAMSKIKIGIAAVLVVAGVATAVREVQAGRVLSEEIRSLQNNRQAIEQARVENERLSASFATTAEKNPDASELGRLRNRIALLKARPEGVVDSEMKPITAYANAGWSTPLAAYETQLWSRTTGDVSEFANAFGWTERGKAKLDAYFRALPDQVRAKHGTPERLLAPMAAAWGRLGPPVAVQIYGQTNHGIKEVVHAWARYASGSEGKVDLLFQRYEDGWRVPHPDEMIDGIIASLDPVTGERRPKAK
jgi:RNA polymerase sigma factor (sigma-70 family)